MQLTDKEWRLIERALRNYQDRGTEPGPAYPGGSIGGTRQAIELADRIRTRP